MLRLRAALLLAVTACAFAPVPEAPTPPAPAAREPTETGPKPRTPIPHVADLTTLVQDGDIVLQQSRSAQSTALRDATHSRYTHTGLVFTHDGAPQVLEAVEPVKWTPLADWVGRGVGADVVLMRRADTAPLEDGGADKLQAAATRYLGRHYDTLFQWTDDRIYCSEVVYKAYQASLGLQIGAVQRMGSFDLAAPSVRALTRRAGPESSAARVRNRARHGAQNGPRISTLLSFSTHSGSLPCPVPPSSATTLSALACWAMSTGTANSTCSP